MATHAEASLESLLDLWREEVSSAAGVDEAVRTRTETRLRDDASALMATGLTADEAFLIALKRLAETDPATPFPSDLASALLPSSAGDSPPKSILDDKTGFLVMLGCALGAALAIKIPSLLGYTLDGAGEEIFALNLSLFILPFMLVFLSWIHRPPKIHVAVIAAVLAAGAVFANAYPFAADAATMTLTALHLPVLGWLAVGVASAGGAWRAVTKRMEFTRFTGEWFITYVLIALGGGVLAALTIGSFQAIGVDAEPFVTSWVIPCGAMAATIVAAWLVESRRNLVGGLAPMLARVFTPLFAILLVALLVGVIWSRGFVDVERELLILFDAMLVLVVALLLYAFSARDPKAAPDFFDRLQLVLMGSALAVDIFALVSIAVRLSEYGLSANKVAALGLNLILLVNLAWAANLQVGFLRSRRAFAEVETWQMRYLLVYAVWAAIVVVVFPPLFGFS